LDRRAGKQIQRRSGHTGTPAVSEAGFAINILHKQAACHCLLTAIRLNYPIEIIH